MSENAKQETIYRDSPNGPNISWKLRNVTDKKWVEINGVFDQGSNVTNIPLEYAEKLGIDLQREESLIVDTVGGQVRGYYVHTMEYEFAGLHFNGPVVFRPGGASGPLLGANPVFFHFNLYFDNEVSQEVAFIPFGVPLTEPLPKINSIMILKQIVGG